MPKQYDPAAAGGADMKYGQYRSNIIADHREEARGPKISQRTGPLSPSSPQEPDTSVTTRSLICRKHLVTSKPVLEGI